MQIIQKIANESVDYGIRLINAFVEWSEAKGEEINIAILDTGIDYNHTDLKDRVKGGINFTSPDRNDYMDRCGHGTFCAGIIAASQNNSGLIGMAPMANLYAVKVLGDQGNGNIMWLQQGIEWCIENNIHIINMSLGFSQSTFEMADVVKRAHEKGIIMIAAVGNDNTKMEVEFPARYPEVIGVTAIDNATRLGGFCTTGEEVDYSAPGVNVTSTYLNNLYAAGSGTSFAAPHITGAIALFQASSKKKQGRFMTLAEITKILDDHVKDLGAPGDDNRYGKGLFHF